MAVSAKRTEPATRIIPASRSDVSTPIRSSAEMNFARPGLSDLTDAQTGAVAGAGPGEIRSRPSIRPSE